MFAPRDVAPAIIAKLNKTINESLSEEAVQQRLTKAGVAMRGSTPEAFGKHMANEVVCWNAVREAAGIPQQQVSVPRSHASSCGGRQRTVHFRIAASTEGMRADIQGHCDREE